MRVYGSSPLFNYVELIFRSKRLFIVSIILASLATTGFYLSRAKTYSARMVVLMTGSEGLTPDAGQRGSIQYKMDVLNVLLKDPNFIKEAMREEHLEQGKSELEFVEFCKQVNASLSYGSDGSILEIGCRWPDRTCEKIVKAFYSKYNSMVFDQETIQSTTRARLLDALVKEYGQKQHDLDLKVIDYQKKSLHNPRQSFDSANGEWIARDQEVKRIEDGLQSAQKQRVLLADALSKTKEDIDESVTLQAIGQSPEYLNAVTARDEAQKKLNTLKLTKTESHPDVKLAQAAYDEAKNKVETMTNEAKTKPSTGIPQTIRRNKNPQYISLQTQLQDQDLAINRLQSSLSYATAMRNKADTNARTAPDEALHFKDMTEDMGLYAGMHASLRAELEGARLGELRDKQLKTAEMKVMVQPEAEIEKSGTKGALMLAAGPILGIVIAFCFSLLAEAQDHSLRTPMEVEKYLNKPVLAVLPRMDSSRKASRRQLEPGDTPRPGLPS